MLAESCMLITLSNRHIAVNAYFLPGRFADRIFCPAGDNIRLNARLHQLANAKLGGL